MAVSTTHNESYSPFNITINKQKLQHIHDVSSLVLGIVAGIMTLESIYGFLFFLIGNFVTNIVFYVICTQGNSHKFFRNPIQEIFIEGIPTDIAGYIMMWCLIYALVKSNS
ncbi:uncharacterized protein KGF55_001118 [Candida pseudojiufengensis]|uniref:uncharacterized protein n=1 Tax=Candida pseudojiufengensis TaxID=497109 RepID=UPI0022257845|nr:uncharacterized protein KGF55_001118 [Candida pseudojiufengensis]KAI5965755.1 hypothetical protein KGF55_001118 [Candida pseudojiufengensis]